MANFDEFRPISGTTDYVSKYDLFITEVQAYANEEEAAREGSGSILSNLTNNYLGYTLGQNVDGNSNNYKCENMAPGYADNDYITVLQANSMTGDVPQQISEVSVTPLLPNDILVIDPGGTYITGRSTKYTTVPSTCAANGNYDMALTSSKPTSLPDNPEEGTVISFADLDGNASLSKKLTISPSVTTGQSYSYIMGLAQDETLVIDDYPYCSFDLVYTGVSAFGWTLARFQR
jgi:hypothetical protein